MMEYIQIVAVLVLSGSLVVAILQLRLLRKQMEAQHDWNRRVTALRYSFTEDPKMREIRSRIEREIGVYRGRELSLDEIHRLEEENPGTIDNIHFVLGRLAGMCAAIKNGIVDEKVCQDLLRGTVINFGRFFRYYIEHTQEVRGNPRVYQCLLEYADKWERQRQKEQRTQLEQDAFEKRNATDQ